MFKMRVALLCIFCNIFLSSVSHRAKAENVISAKYTEEEIGKLKKFREMTDSNIEENGYMKTDGYLIRWLRAKNMNLDSAKESFDKAMKWRSENNISRILQEDLGHENSRNSFYTITDGVDREGRPIMEVEIKKMDTRKFTLSGNSKLFSRTWYQIYEKLEDKIYKTELTTGGNLGQGVMVEDLSGYNLPQHACLACVPTYLDATRSYERYYPGLFNKIFLVNAPRIFSSLLELLRPAMSPLTRDAMNVFGSDKSEWQPKILQTISPEQLPVKFGGTKPTV